jgi:hypothetical protein
MTILAVLAAAIVSAFAGVGAAAAIGAWLVRHDPSAQGIGAAYLFAAMLYVVVAALVLGIAAFRREPGRRIGTALAALLVAPLMLAAFNLWEEGLARKDLLAWTALFVPMWVVAIVQWVVLRWWIGRAAARAEQ